jgi:hypothetical protein
MKIVLELRAVHSPDVRGRVQTWRPSDPREVHFLLQLQVGAVGAKEVDDFQVMVATPEGLAAHRPPDARVMSDRALIVLSEYSWPVLEGCLKEILSRCEAFSRDDCLAKLGRYFIWEHEDQR